MIPKTYPTDASGYMKVGEVADTTGLTEWVDYIPVQVVTEVPASANSYENDGYIEVITAS